MPSSHPHLRRQMQEEHNFLYKLYCEKDGQRNRARLAKATGKQVWIVLRLLFCIAAGHIPISSKNYRRLLQSKRRNTLRSLKNRMKYFRNGQNITELRRQYILQFAVLYHFLFEDLFVPIDN